MYHSESLPTINNQHNLKDERQTEGETDVRSLEELFQPREKTRQQQQEKAIKQKDRWDYEEKPVQDVVFYFCSPGWKQENRGGRQEQKSLQDKLNQEGA